MYRGFYIKTPLWREVICLEYTDKKLPNPCKKELKNKKIKKNKEFTKKGVDKTGNGGVT